MSVLRMPDFSDSFVPDPLVERIRAGDTDALASFHAGCYAKVWRFAFSYTRAHHTANEIVQDSFVRIWEQRDRLDPHGNLLAYLYCLIRNAAIDYQRHARVISSAEALYVSESTLPGMGEPAPGPDARVELAETKAALARAIAALSEQRRAALLLRWQHEMSYDEIAQALGVTSAAARQLVVRARGAIRIALGLTE